MKKNILLTVSVITVLNCYSQKTIKISDKLIDINKIPRNKSLVLENNNKILMNLKDSNGLLLRTKKIYKSLDNEYFAITEQINPVNIKAGANIIYEGGSCSIKLIDSKNNIIWIKEKKSGISDCLISNKGKYIYTLWIKEFSDEKELEAYNNSGNVIKSFKNVNNIYKRNYGDILYLTRINNDNNKWELICFNPNNNGEWNIVADSYIYVLAISAEENYIVFSIGNLIYSYNYLGEKLWEKDNISLGLFSLSQNGKYLLRMPEKNGIEIYNNQNGSLLLKNDKLLINNKIYSPSFGSFVSNSDIIGFCENINKNKSHLVFMALNGEYIKNVFIENSYKSYPYFEIDTGKKVNIYYDGLLISSLNL